MPAHIQPTSLLELSLSAVGQLLLDNSRQLNLQYQLPAALRQRLLLQLCADTSADASQLVGQLLAPDISQLCVELCCYYGCTHQLQLLRLLATPAARGLTHLQLTRTALLRLDQCLLQSVLLNAAGLKQLILRNIASDATLSAVGSSCHQLTHLDVSNSRQVTDNGIKQLFLQIELRNKTAESADRRRHRSSNCAVSITTSRRANFLSRTARLFRCLSSEEDSSSDSFLLECFERQTAVCNTLQVLNVTNTGITSVGVCIALENCTHLQSVGDYAHMSQALHLYENRAEQLRPLKLVNVTNTITNQKALELIYTSCPKLQRLTLRDTRFNFAAPPLHTPATLTSLTLLMVPASADWLTHFYSHEATPRLSQLTLVFRAPVHVQLYPLMQACTRLQCLTIDGASIDYQPPNHNTTPCYHNLRKIHLGQTVSPSVVHGLVAHCPHLTVAHFYHCPALTTVASASLQCFYIYQTTTSASLGEAHSSNLGETIAALLANCPRLEHLGNLANWHASNRQQADASTLVQSISAANYRLQFEAGAHWYHSKCITNYE
ncbi:uncharacterized protein LOC111058019 isoform X2 [Nilaparvata lugens]|uniref:uncharacterized protein LOC111058019 isoform X2 n=1 Tax=Nilaparvata lugens TaxID=108931 RepID=UPI00193E9518|nr:uncharacterized protein LOC111058019 isoform X2 [Nilaparvata lugens]